MGRKGERDTKGKGIAEPSKGKGKKKAFKIIDTNMGFHIQSQPAKDLYEKILPRNIVPTRFMDVNVLDIIGIHQDIKWLLYGAKWYNFFLVNRPTYEALTYEFICTFEWSDSTIEFQLRDKHYEVDVEEFFKHHGITSLPSKTDDDDEYDEDVFWKKLTGEDEYVVKQAKSSKFPHPAFRYLHRVLAHTIYARNESDGNVRTEELKLLWSMVYRKPANIAECMFAHWISIQHGTINRGDICMGGFVTILAEYVNCNLDDLEPIPGPQLVDIAVCSKMHMLRQVRRKKGIYELTIKSRANPIPLPLQNTTVKQVSHWQLKHIPDIPLLEGTQSQGERANDQEAGTSRQARNEDVEMEEASPSHDPYYDEQEGDNGPDYTYGDPYDYSAEIQSLKHSFDALRQDQRTQHTQIRQAIDDQGREFRDDMQDLRAIINDMSTAFFAQFPRPGGPPPDT